MSSIFLYAVTVLAWGSTWLAIEFQLGTVAPEVSIVYRYAIAAAVLFGWCVLRKLPLRFALKDHGTFALLGVTLFGLNYILTYSAQQYISSALNAIAFSTMLWMNIINARIFFSAALEPRVLAGAVLGIVGVTVLFWPEVEHMNFTDATLLGATLCLSGAFVASLGNMVSQRAQSRKLPVLQSNAWGMFYGMLLTGIVAGVKGVPVNIEWTFAYMGSLLYLAVVGSVVAFGSYLTLLGRIGAARAGYAVVMFPVVALVLSFLFEGLIINGYIVAGVILVLSGNAVILSGRRVPPRSEEASTKSVNPENAPSPDAAG